MQEVENMGENPIDLTMGSKDVQEPFFFKISPGFVHSVQKTREIHAMPICSEINPY